MISDLKTSLGWGLALCLMSHVSSVSAADAPEASTTGPSRTACLDAHRDSQELRKAGKLLESQEQLLICSSESCPGAIITDCGKWLSEVDQLTPSLAFEVRVDGKDSTAAQVELDGRVLPDWSKSIKVNPGRHDVRVVVQGFEPYSDSLLTLEGQRLKMVSADFKTKQPEASKVPSPPPAPVYTRPTPTATYVLLGVGVLGAAGFATFASIGKTKQNQLDNDCTKLMTCTDEDLKPMKTMYLIGDISAGVGAAALLGAAISYFTRPSVESPVTSFNVGTVGGSQSSFGVSASRPW